MCNQRRLARRRAQRNLQSRPLWCPEV
jgi:hypothetical protein